MPNLVVIFGPPASGKAAIGSKAAEALGYRFFHNHHTANPVAALFGWLTPKFTEVLYEVRDLLFERAAQDPDITGVVFTFVWAFDESDDTAKIDHLVSKFTQSGGKVHFVELLASLDTRIQRECTPFRRKNKPNQNNLEEAIERQRALDARYTMNTTGVLPLEYPHLIINTEQLSEESAAHQVVQFVDMQNGA
ncbi:MAG: hypothetical protein WBN90_03410 [Gammaproteobacteria bacterium]